MADNPNKNRYYLVKEKAMSEVLLKVVEAKRLLEKQPQLTVQEVTDRIGLSRSSFYRYKDDVSVFHENSGGKTITFMIQLDDQPGYLSGVLQEIAAHHGNILTIHQSIPINGVALLTFSVRISEAAGDVESMMADIEKKEGVHDIRIVGRE